MLILFIAAASATTPDPIQLMAARQRLQGEPDLDPTAASVVTGHTAPSGTRSLRWQRMGGDVVAERSGTPESERVCSRLSGRDPVPGPRQIRLDTDAADALPTMLLVSEDTHESVRVSLAPGEQITAITATTTGGEHREYLELTQAGGRLTLVREGQGSLVCFESADEPG